MNREELVDLLGTIAKSGSKAFKAESAGKQLSAEAIIGITFF
jgi:HSP90 family molecular chaperone